MISVKHIYTASKKLGFSSVATILGKEFFLGLYSTIFSKGRVQHAYSLPTPNLSFPIFCRAFTSDLYVYYQIFVDMGYHCTDFIQRPKLIVDCGANVGYTSAFFLNKYTGAQVIAIEPEPENFKILKRNLSPYGKRITMLNAAVWSTPTKLCVKRDLSAFRSEWATKVVLDEEACGVGTEVDAIDIGGLLKDSGYDRIDILKIDVEGAESVIFSENYAAWIDKVDCFLIELHNDEGSDCFFRALSSSDESYCFSRHGESTVAIRENACA